MQRGDAAGGPRLQVVLDMDQTLMHCAASTDQARCDYRFPDDVFVGTREEQQARRPLCEIERARRAAGRSEEVYGKIHPVRFEHRGRRRETYYKVRPYVFEAVETMREFADIHVYTKGYRTYATAVLTNMFGSLGNQWSLINGQVVTKDDDTGETKDLSAMFPEEVHGRVVAVDDQPSVWRQMCNVIPVPPFLAFSHSADDCRMEAEERFLMRIVLGQLRQISNRVGQGGHTAADSLRQIRSTLFKRRPAKVLVVAKAPAQAAPKSDGSDAYSLTELADLLVLHGGQVATRPDASVTHIISDSEAHCKKAAAAAPAGRPRAEWLRQCSDDVQTVAVQWLIDSLLFAHRMGEQRYHPSQIGKLSRLDGQVDVTPLPDGGFCAAPPPKRTAARKAHDWLLCVSHHHRDFLKVRLFAVRRETVSASVAAALVVLAHTLPTTAAAQFQRRFFTLADEGGGAAAAAAAGPNPYAEGAAAAAMQAPPAAVVPARRIAAVPQSSLLRGVLSAGDSLLGYVRGEDERTHTHTHTQGLAREGLSVLQAAGRTRGEKQRQRRCCRQRCCVRRVRRAVAAGQLLARRFAARGGGGGGGAARAVPAGALCVRRHARGGGHAAPGGVGLARRRTSKPRLRAGGAGRRRYAGRSQPHDPVPSRGGSVVHEHRGGVD